MYDFRDLDIDRQVHSVDYPTEMVSYGGHWLDKEIEGFRTLASTGRHGFSRDVNTTNRTGDGAVYLSSRLEARKIEVSFYLVANSIKEYNDRMRKLKQILATPNQSIIFADDPDNHFTGTVTELSIDDQTLNTTGKIEFSLQDPFSHSVEVTVSGSGSSIKVSNNAMAYQQAPKHLTFTPSAQVASLTITCGDKKIVLNVGAPAGQPVAIDFDTLEVTLNKVLIMESISLDSNIGDFWIKDGATINFNATGEYEMVYEVKQL